MSLLWEAVWGPRHGLHAGCREEEVTVVEKNDWFGGKAALLEDRGYRFDMGPTILTLPSVLRRIFSEAEPALETSISRWSASTRSGGASSPTGRASTSSSRSRR